MKLFTKPLFENAHFFNNKLYRFFSRAELFSVYGAATFWFYDIYLTYSEQSLGLGTSGYMYAAVACALGTAFFSKEQEKIYHHQLSTTEKIFPFLHSKIVHDEYNENVRRLVDLILSGNLSSTEEAEAKRRYEALISSKIREAFQEEKHPEVDVESLNNNKMENLPLPNNATLPTRSHSHKYFYHK